MRSSKPGFVYLRDANTIQMIMASGVPIIDTYEEQGTVYFGFRDEEADPILKKWYGNEPIPLADGRMFILAQVQFKSILKRRLED